MMTLIILEQDKSYNVMENITDYTSTVTLVKEYLSDEQYEYIPSPISIELWSSFGVLLSEWDFNKNDFTVKF